MVKAMWNFPLGAVCCVHFFGSKLVEVKLLLILILDSSAFAVAAVFSLAYKLQPAIIFIDEVDSFLGQRRNTDHEALTNMKTEFMALWDGFTTDREYFGPPALIYVSLFL